MRYGPKLSVMRQKPSYALKSQLRVFFTRSHNPGGTNIYVCIYVYKKKLWSFLNLFKTNFFANFATHINKIS